MVDRVSLFVLHGVLFEPLVSSTLLFEPSLGTVVVKLLFDNVDAAQMVAIHAHRFVLVAFGVRALWLLRMNVL